ncbi:MAG: ABC transporter ATP-binding protein [Oculatellaceae cyanobacterium Prado106]|nr:ABC transporter ATP-binding protein [Oculatellaceae cyanobacterium Prado106]
MPTSILDLQAVTRQFQAADAPAVAAVSLSLKQGDLLALLGPSGCGKTTLLRLIAGFEQPQSGTIAIAQQPVAGSGQWVPPEKRGIGMVFQDYALFPHLTVAQNIAFGLHKRQKASQKPTQWIQQRVEETLHLVGLSQLESRYPHQLSGGQQQRVALARALAPYPLLVLLDEPLSNLDVQVRLRLRQELRTILKAAGTSAILVTHDQEEALSIADRVAVMRQGHIEQEGTPEALYAHPTSPFVAEFVAQANLLPAQRSGNHWQTDLGALPLHQVNAPPAAATLTVMVRQEDLRLQPDSTSPFVICDRQFLGREYRYSLTSPTGKTWVARTGLDTNLAIGTAVKVAIVAQPLNTFATP